MNDIVKQLRANSECHAPHLMIAAADEIQRLRDEVKDCENLIDLYERAEADRTRFQD